MQSGRIVGASGREQHPHEVRRDPRVLRRERERLPEARVRRAVIGLEGRRDAEPVRDPRLRRRAPGRDECVPEDLPGVFGHPLREGRPSRAEKRLGSERRAAPRQLRRPFEVGPGGGEVAAVQCDVPEPEDRLGGLRIALREGEIEPAGHLDLPGGEGGRGHRKAAPEQLVGVRGIVARRKGRAAREHGEERDGHGPARGTKERTRGHRNQGAGRAVSIMGAEAYLREKNYARL